METFYDAIKFDETAFYNTIIISKLSFFCALSLIHLLKISISATVTVPSTSAAPAPLIFACHGFIQRSSSHGGCYTYNSNNNYVFKHVIISYPIPIARRLPT